MSRHAFDVLVVGAGAVGSAVFHELVKQGRSVALIERRRVGLGVTAYSGGIVRCFHPDAMLTDRALYSYRYFCDFAEHTGRAAPFARIGQLYFVSGADEASARAEIVRLSRLLRVEVLSPSDALRICPTLRAGHHEELVAHEPGAGYVDTVSVTRAWVDAGVSYGGTLMEGVTVNSLLVTSSGVCGASTNLGPIYARQVVLCVGPQLMKFLDEMQLDHPFFAKAVEVFQVDLDPKCGPHPAFTDDIHGLNGRPCADGSMLVGCPTNDRNYTDGDQQPDFSRAEHVLRVAALRFDWASTARVRSGFRAYDTYAAAASAEPMFADEHQTLILPGAFNGGSFKFTPTIARDVAHLIAKDKRSALQSHQRLPA